MEKATVGRHLSELELSEYVGYPNAFSKTTPTISGYFHRVSGLVLPVVWQLKTQDNFYGQGRLRNKGESNCQTHPLGTASLPQEMETNATMYREAGARRLVYFKVPVRYRPNAASGGWGYGRDLASAVKMDTPL